MIGRWFLFWLVMKSLMVWASIILYLDWIVLDCSTYNPPQILVAGALCTVPLILRARVLVQQ